MKDLPYELWEPVIGLEIHLQLNTKTKLFSGAPNRFGDEPNTNISAVCVGLPGSLPVVNKMAVKKAILFGHAINATISPFSLFERKSYFYPDTPRNFQITQREYPLLIGGRLFAKVDGVDKEFQIHHSHLEDDSGNLRHFSDFAGIDFNRAGIPLLEIVSDPVMHTAKEASAYAQAIKAIAEYTGISEGDMDRGCMRIDANVSIRPKGSNELRSKTEIKNVNSFNFLEMAIEAEISRQMHIYANEGEVVAGTYRWDAAQKKILLMRPKETAEDYRYFPEPDLLPLTLAKEYIDEIKKELPELPHERCQRYIDEYHLSEHSAIFLTNEKVLADYFEEGLSYCSNAKSLSNWITVEFIGRLKEKNQTLFSIKLPAKHVAKLVSLIDQGLITGKIAKSIADEMVAFPQKDPEIIFKENPDYQPLCDNNAIEEIVDQVLRENPQSILDYKAGRTKALAFVIGQIMKLSKGKASPSIVNELLHKKLD